METKKKKQSRKKAENKKVKAVKKRPENFDDIVETTVEAGKKAKKQYRNFRADFKKFIAKGNAIDLAVAVVIGTAFNNIVNVLVKNVITPLTGLIFIPDNISSLKWTIRDAVPEDVTAGIAARDAIVVEYGLLLQAIIDFLIIALSIYIVLKIIMKIKDAFHKKERLAEEAEKARIQAEAEAEAERQEKLKREFIDDVAAQADLLDDIKTILLRMEKNGS